MIHNAIASQVCLVTLLALSFLYSDANAGWLEERRWNEAKRENTAKSYKAYLEKYDVDEPRDDGEHVIAAKVNLALLELEERKVRINVSSIRGMTDVRTFLAPILVALPIENTWIDLWISGKKLCSNYSTGGLGGSGGRYCTGAEMTVGSKYRSNTVSTKARYVTFTLPERKTLPASVSKNLRPNWEGIFTDQWLPHFVTFLGENYGYSEMPFSTLIEGRDKFKRLPWNTEYELIYEPVARAILAAQGKSGNSKAVNQFVEVFGLPTVDSLRHGYRYLGKAAIGPLNAAIKNGRCERHSNENGCLESTQKIIDELSKTNN